MASVTAIHRGFLDRALPILESDPAIAGVAAAGSYLTDRLDEHSDLDLVIAVADDDRAATLKRKLEIAGALGPLLSAFTGEHVGEPDRLLICMYGPPLLHVDLKFVSLSELGDRVENPAVLFDRDGALSAAMSGEPAPPVLDREWLRARFWTWIHYGASKAARGELFECLTMLDILRQRVLGPLALTASGQSGLDAQGLRRLELLAPDWVEPLAATVARVDQRSCLEALAACCDAYDRLREALGQPTDGAVEIEVRRFVTAKL